MKLTLAVIALVANQCVALSLPGLEMWRPAETEQTKRCSHTTCKFVSIANKFKSGPFAGKNHLEVMQIHHSNDEKVCHTFHDEVDGLDLRHLYPDAGWVRTGQKMHCGHVADPTTKKFSGPCQCWLQGWHPNTKSGVTAVGKDEGHKDAGAGKYGNVLPTHKYTNHHDGKDHDEDASKSATHDDNLPHADRVDAREDLWKPKIKMVGTKTLTLEAAWKFNADVPWRPSQTTYDDQGASCSDASDGILRVTAKAEGPGTQGCHPKQMYNAFSLEALPPRIACPATDAAGCAATSGCYWGPAIKDIKKALGDYQIIYECTNSHGTTTSLTRKVQIMYTGCPCCTSEGWDGTSCSSSQHNTVAWEGANYVDAPVRCLDHFSGHVATQCDSTGPNGFVSTDCENPVGKVPGTYQITYHAKNSAGITNDSPMCRGVPATYTRTVEVGVAPMPHVNLVGSDIIDDVKVQPGRPGGYHDTGAVCRDRDDGWIDSYLNYVEGPGTQGCYPQHLYRPRPDSTRSIMYPNPLSSPESCAAATGKANCAATPGCYWGPFIMNLNEVPGEYHISYRCKNSKGVLSHPGTRVVFVTDVMGAAIGLTLGTYESSSRTCPDSSNDMYRVSHIDGCSARGSGSPFGCTQALRECAQACDVQRLCTQFVFGVASGCVIPTDSSAPPCIGGRIFKLPDGGLP